MGEEQDRETGSMASYPYIIRPPEHELQQSPHGAAQVAYMEFLRGKGKPNPLEQHGKTYLKQDSHTTPPDTLGNGYGSNGYGPPPSTSDETMAPDQPVPTGWNGMANRWDVPQVRARNNKTVIHNYYYVPPYYMAPDQLGRFNDSEMAHGYSAYAGHMVPQNLHGGSTAANSYVKYPKQYGETAYAYATPPKQQTLELHLKEPVMVDDKVSRDDDRRRRIHLENLHRLTGYSGKFTPTGPKTRPYKSSTAASPGHRGRVMGAFLLSNKLCDSESEDSD